MPPSASGKNLNSPRGGPSVGRTPWSVADALVGLQNSRTRGAGADGASAPLLLVNHCDARR